MRRSEPSRLRIDPTACEGVGVCAHLAPDLITLDSWGYPIIVEAILKRGEVKQAASAVTACPRRALFTTG